MRSREVKLYGFFKTLNDTFEGQFRINFRNLYSSYNLNDVWDDYDKFGLQNFASVGDELCNNSDILEIKRL